MGRRRWGGGRGRRRGRGRGGGGRFRRSGFRPGTGPITGSVRSGKGDERREGEGQGQGGEGGWAPIVCENAAFEACCVG